MNIRFMNNKYELQSDQYQLLLYEVRVRKGEWNGRGKKPNMDKVGEEYLTNVKSLPSLDAVLRYVYDHEIRMCDATTFEELFEVVKKIQEDIAEVKELLYSIVQ